MEGKVGVVATEVEAIGRHGRHRLTRRRYVATFGDADRIGGLTDAAAHTLGGDRAPQQTVLGDGAEWITTQASRHVPEATTMLDGSHVDRAVPKAIRAARPGTANKEVRRQAHQTIPALLWVGDVDGAVTALQALLPADAPPPATLTETITYLQLAGAAGLDWRLSCLAGSWRAHRPRHGRAGSRARDQSPDDAARDALASSQC